MKSKRVLVLLLATVATTLALAETGSTAEATRANNASATIAQLQPPAFPAALNPTLSTCSGGSPCQPGGATVGVQIIPGLHMLNLVSVQVAMSRIGDSYSYLLSRTLTSSSNSAVAQNGIAPSKANTHPIRSVADDRAPLGKRKDHSVPEPGTLAIFGAGLIGLFGVRQQLIR